MNYVADNLAAITTRLFRMAGNEKFEIPFFRDLHDKPKPKESAAEIKQKVLDRLSH